MIWSFDPQPTNQPLIPDPWSASMASVISSDVQSIDSLLSNTSNNLSKTDSITTLSLESREFDPRREYDDIDWEKIPGFQMPPHSKVDKRSWIWKHGWQVEKTSSGDKFWLCAQLLQGKQDKEIIFCLNEKRNYPPRKRTQKSNQAWKAVNKTTSSKGGRRLNTCT